jgi:CrcB protein
MEAADVNPGLRKLLRGGFSASDGRDVVDPDVDLHDPAQRRETRPRGWDLLLAVATGGALGAEARYGIEVALPHAAAAFPWSTVLINASGCLLIGVLMVLVLELTSPHRLLRPFLGVGILGGFTTYSTFAVDAERLVRAHRPLLALAYVVLSLVLCLVAVYAATLATRAVGRAVCDSHGHRNDRRRR